MNSKKIEILEGEIGQLEAVLMLREQHYYGVMYANDFIGIVEMRLGINNPMVKGIFNLIENYINAETDIMKQNIDYAKTLLNAKREELANPTNNKKISSIFSKKRLYND